MGGEDGKEKIAVREHAKRTRLEREKRGEGSSITNNRG